METFLKGELIPGPQQTFFWPKKCTGENAVTLRSEGITCPDFCGAAGRSSILCFYNLVPVLQFLDNQLIDWRTITIRTADSGYNLSDLGVSKNIYYQGICLFDCSFVN